MSVSIQYDRGEVPPFPYVNLAVSRPVGNNYESMPGMIDTGASLTIIPKYLIDSLDLQRVKEVLIGAFDGSAHTYAEYRVNIKIGDALYEYVSVIATQRNDVVIGRNVINLWRMRLDGLNLTGKITP